MFYVTGVRYFETNSSEYYEKPTSAHEDMWIYYTVDVMSLLHVSACDVYTVINSHIYIRTYWFYSSRESSVHGHEIFKILLSASNIGHVCSQTPPCVKI